MKFNFIIPVAEKDKKYLKRCLLAVLDQDYKNFDVTVVYDGFKGKEPVKRANISYVQLRDVSGAAHARNYGVYNSSGDVLFFLDVDCKINPGILRIVKDTFDTDKTIDFVYGAYRFNDGRNTVYHSRPYDPYLLESMNYICTMSPIKRQVFDSLNGFDVALPFFQDWDLFLRAAREGRKGKYIKNILFSTEVPDETSISGNATVSFRDKVLKIESTNKIKSRKLCVTTLAAPFQSIERAKILDARYIGAHNDSLMVQTPAMFDVGYSTVLCMGFFPEAVESHIGLFPKNCNKIICWIGTDVWQLRNKFNWESIKHFKQNILPLIDHQYSNSPELQEELRELGIETELLYQPIIENIAVTPLQEPTVSAYFSEGHPLHNQWYLQDLAKSMPHVKFMFYGTGFESTIDGNVHYCGWKPVQEIIDNSTVHIRITGHDGFPHMPIHHLLAGRQVLCNFPLKYADYIDCIPNQSNWEQIKVEIVNRLTTMLKNPFPHNVQEVRDYYYTLCNKDKYKETIYERIKVIENGKAKNNLRNADLSKCGLSS